MDHSLCSFYATFIEDKGPRYKEISSWHIDYNNYLVRRGDLLNFNIFNIKEDGRYWKGHYNLSIYSNINAIVQLHSSLSKASKIQPVN